VDSITAAGTAQLLGVPQQDVQVTLDAMSQAGDLVPDGQPARTYSVPLGQKQRLENMFRAAAQELGEHGVLMQT
jgi:hypothetical protein